MKQPNKIITSPELDFFMQLHKMDDLSELLQHDDATLLKMEGFGWRLMKEVLGLRKIQKL